MEQNTTGVNIIDLNASLKIAYHNKNIELIIRDIFLASTFHTMGNSFDGMEIILPDEELYEACLPLCADQLEISLEKLREELSSEPVYNGKEVEVMCYMASVDKIKTTIPKKIPRPFIFTPKLDGVSFMVGINKNGIYLAHTRGSTKGIKQMGTNVTHVARELYTPSDTILRDFDEIILRGEFVCTDKETHSPAAVASGILNCDTTLERLTDESGNPVVTLVFFEICKFKLKKEQEHMFGKINSLLPKTDKFVLKNSKKNPDGSISPDLYLQEALFDAYNIPHVSPSFLENENLDTLESEFSEVQRTIPYPVDGIVIQPLNWVYPIETPVGGIGKYAYKPSMQELSVIHELIPSIGKNGVYAFKVRYDPVVFDKEYQFATIAYSDLCEGGKLRGIGPGSSVCIRVRGGIPGINSLSSKSETPFPLLKKCISCNKSLTINGKKLECTNPQCPEINYKKLEKFFSALGVKGLAYKNIKTRLENAPHPTIQEFISFSGTKSTEIQMIKKAVLSASPELFLKSLSFGIEKDETLKKIVEDTKRTGADAIISILTSYPFKNINTYFIANIKAFYITLT